jgi:hypothetical protein
MDCGRFLRSDGYTAAKERLDYARVLLATPALTVIKKEEHLLVDGCLVEIKIIEEWGYDLGDDACLLENDTGSRRCRPREVAKRSRTTRSRASAEHSTSSSSIINDWQHWVAIQGHDHAVEDDVREVENFIGATFKGENANMFNVGVLVGGVGGSN